MLYDEIFSGVKNGFVALISVAIGFILFLGVIIVFAKGREMTDKLFSKIQKRGG